jgi:hypothetical protein
VYQLGRVRFSVTCGDPAFEQVLARMLPLCDEQSIAPDDVVDVRLGYGANIAGLTTRIVERHTGFIWLYGATLTSADGFKATFCGGPGTGKTTMALALAFGHGWKILAEHFTLIDPERNEIISFAAPFAVKGSTREQMQTLEIPFAHFIMHDWLPISSEHIAQNCQTPLDLFVYLDGEHTDAHLDCSTITAHDCLRKLLHISNLLTVAGGNDKVFDYLPERCYRFSNGSVRERVEKVIELSVQCKSKSSLPLSF